MDDTENNKEEREKIDSIVKKIENSRRLAKEDSIKRLKIIDERLASHGEDEDFCFPIYIFHLMLKENSNDNNTLIKWLLRRETNGLYEHAGLNVKQVDL